MSSLYITNLSHAYTCMREICDSHKTKKKAKKQLFLTPEFRTSSQPVDLRVASLIRSINTSYTCSTDCDRIAKAHQMYTWLGQIPGLKEQFNDRVIEQINSAKALLDEAALQEIPERLLLLKLIQEYIEQLSLCFEKAASLQVQEDLSLKTLTYLNPKKDSSLDPGKYYAIAQKPVGIQDILSFMAFTVGLALVAKISWVPYKEGYCLNISVLNNEDLEEIQICFAEVVKTGVMRVSYPEMHAFCEQLNEATKVQIINKKFSKEVEALGNIATIFMANMKSSHFHWITSSFFPFINLFEQLTTELTDGVKKNSTKDCVFKLHKSFARALGIRDDLHKTYKELYQKYQQLLAEKTCRLSSSQEAAPTILSSLSTPEEFAALRFDFTPSYLLSKKKTFSHPQEKQESKAPLTEVERSESSVSSKEARKKAHRAKQKMRSSSSQQKASTSISVAGPVPPPSSSSSLSFPITTPPSLSSSSSSAILTESTPTSSSTSTSSTKASSFSSSSPSSRTDVAAPPYMSNVAGPPVTKGADISRRTPHAPPPTTLFANQLRFSSDDYAQRVIDWFENPKSSLSEARYAAFTPHQKQESTWRHAFSPFVDKFVGTSYSYKDDWVTESERKTFYGVVGEVVWKGKTYRGVFQYCFDNHGVLYHRCFGSISNIELLDIFVNRKRPEIEYPSLAESASLAKAKPRAAISADGLPYEVDPLNIVSFEDPRHELSISLFKLGQRYT